MRNSGTCTWNQHYTLAFRGGDRLGAQADHYSIAGPVAPGATVDVGVPLVAPAQAGPHAGSWELEAPDGRRFGVGRNNSALTVVVVVEGQTAIRGLVWQDQNGNNRRDGGEEMANVNVLLFGHPDCSVQLGRTATTAVGGAYAFYDLAPGRYCVVVTDASGALVQELVQVAPGQQVVEVNLRWPLDAGDPGTIAGVVFRDVNGNNSYDNGDEVVGGREVWLLRGHCDRQAPDASTTTGTDGRYTFKPLPPGVYCVSLRFPGGLEDAQSVILGAGQVLSELHLRAHLGETTATIGGLLWHDHCFLAPDGTWQGNCVDVDPARGRTANGVRDAGEEGIGGVTIRLLPGPCGTGNLTVLASALTAADGTYTFSNLGVGTYCVSMNAAEPGNAEQLLPGDWTYPAPGIWYHELTLSAAERRTDIDFGWDYQFR